MSDIDLQEYGQLIQKVEQLTADMRRVNDQLTNITQILSQADGGWRALVYVGGAAATLTAGVSWALSHVSFIR